MKIKLTIICMFLLSSSACSFDKMYVRLSTVVIESKIEALNHETDYEMVKQSLPGDLELLEGMLSHDPDNKKLNGIAARAYYSYAFGFMDEKDTDRASEMYYRSYSHGMRVLNSYGITRKLVNGPTDQFQTAVNKLNKNTLQALFWTALSWAKIIELNYDKLLGLMQMHKVVILMKRAQSLDEKFYMSGPTLFFAVYYGSRSPLLGGDYPLSERLFDKVRTENDSKLLLVDLLQAQYLENQRGNKKSYIKLLRFIVNSPDDLLPKNGLVNTIAKRKAGYLLKQKFID